MKILIADDDISFLLALKRNIEVHFPSFEVIANDNPNDLDRLANDLVFNLAVIDINFGEGFEEYGLKLLTQILNKNSIARILILTGTNDKKIGWLAIKLGAHSFINKPFDLEHLNILIKDALSQYSLREKANLYEKFFLDEIYFGESDGAQKIYEQISFAASNDMPVLITGEPGTGKSTIAKLIHKLSKRRNLGRFCVLHPGLSNDEQVYVELFGARKGAYTGLTENRTGLVEFANKGTLFLDDVTDFTPNIQVLLLRVLEEKKFRRLGETDDRISDFRLISATNQNPEKLVNEGTLRFDFFSRIARLTIYVPPLRKRKNDIVPLAEHILRKISSDNNSSELQLSPECYEYLVNETWRGNIRELLAALERAYHFAIYEGSGVILPKHFQFCALGDASIEKPLGLNEAVDEFRKSLILKKLIEADWNISETARQLRIDRNQLRRYVSRYGLQSRKSEIS